MRAGELQISHTYRIRWARAFARSQDRNSRITETKLPSERKFVFSLDGTHADAQSIAAKVREIVARAEATLPPALDHPYVVKRRLRVSCKTAYLVSTRKRSSTGVPALMQAALAEQQVVLKSKKVCSVHYRLSRMEVTETTSGKRDFEIRLPDLQAAAQP